MQFSGDLLKDRVMRSHNIFVKSLDGDMKIVELNTNYSSEYAKENEVLMIVENPSPQARDEIIEFAVPFYNYTISEVVNGTVKEVKDFDKFLPRVWHNANATGVEPYCQLRV